LLDAYEVRTPMQLSTQPSHAADETPGGPAFLIHNEVDSVAVATNDIAPGTRDAVYMDSDRRVSVAVVEPILLGHKVALTDLAEGADVIEYGVRIGLARMPIAAGQLVHVHNIRSARWQTSL
jgi:(2R)-sulfolactate sulfo-lyase subunit alpha